MYRNCYFASDCISSTGSDSKRRYILCNRNNNINYNRSNRRNILSNAGRTCDRCYYRSN